MDWELVQAFVAVADHGSLSGGARALGSSQPTMSRHVVALEQQLGIQLFDRTGSGLELTAAGTDLLEHAHAMNDAAGRFSLAAGGKAEAVAGSVRITASAVVSAFVLPQVLVGLHRAEPEIDIELVSSDRTENLLQREADIAVRMYRPTQADVITRKVGELKLGIFAADTYIAERGRPLSFEDFEHHEFIGYDKSGQIIDGFQQAGYPVGRDFFSFRCDDQVMCWQMVVAGYGVGLNQLKVGLATPGLQHILPDIDLPTLPVWLTAHAELKTSKRVRRVYDFLTGALSEAFS